MNTEVKSKTNDNIYHSRSEEQRPQSHSVIPSPIRTYAVPVSAKDVPLFGQESRRHKQRDEYPPPPPAPLPPRKEVSHVPAYDYEDPYADVKVIGDAQYSKSHLINGEKRNKKKRKKKQKKGQNGRKGRTTRMPPVHRYPTEPASQESQPIERYPEYTDLPDEGYMEPLTSGAESYGDEMSDSEVAQFQPQPSNDYADEADPDYDDDGYGGDHDDDYDDDSSESRSKTYVASGTGPIPSDMRAYADDDVADPYEAAADAFIAERERQADRSIDYYKSHEQRE